MTATLRAITAQEGERARTSVVSAMSTEAACAWIEERPVLAARHARSVLTVLVAVRTPRWPADGGPWWSSAYVGLIADLSPATDDAGWARLAFADVVAELEHSLDVQEFWWAGWPSPDDNDAPHVLASTLVLLREAIVFAAAAGGT